jgi:amino acid adenylation domain-containing protein/non-ribosomal peptide synthase protein (TIGR01720 family)
MEDAERPEGMAALDEKLASDRAYWLEKLEGDPPLIGFPADFVRPAEPGLREHLALPLARATVERLLAACGGRETLVLAALVAVTKILLHRYTGAEDVVVGTTIHRRHAEIAAWNRLLALRDRLAPRDTVREALGRIKATLSEAYDHQKFPFQRLLGLLQVARKPGCPALFSVAVILDTVNDRSHLAQAVTDSLLVFERSGDGLAGHLEYDSGLFSRASMEGVAGHFGRLLATVLTRPEAALGDLDLSDEGERERLLVGFNRTACDYPREKTVHRLFLEQVLRSPGAPAAGLAGGYREPPLTYRELAGRSQGIATLLRAVGVRPGDRVGILLDHSLDLVAAVLGVLRAGAAFVPIDPEHPAGRIEHVMSDAVVRRVLTRGILAGRLPEAVQGLALDVETLPPSQGCGEGPEAVVDGGWPAYVIYTSGSTGKPKGVEVTHRSLVNYLTWAQRVYLGGEPLSFPLYTSLSFDLTLTSLFAPLLAGGCLWIHPRRGPGEFPLLEVLADDRVDALKLTPSHLELIRDRDLRGSRIRCLIVGGEALSATLAAEIAGSFGGGVEIYNEYGPTETTVGCMLHRFVPEDGRRAAVPIGGPAANVELRLLDGGQRPAAAGQAGELYIAGDGVALGYIGRPDLTAERFLPDPRQTGGRMYRSGDLARWIAGGGLEFLGRRDEQIKLRGFRVELGEIRSALNRHPEIRDCVVVLVREAQEPVLVAYYAARRELTEEGLHEFLAQSLLVETIPAFFIHLRRLPLTLNGKVNLEALPRLAEVRERSRPGYVEPRNRAEAMMAEIWRSVLGVPRVGIHDNFFQLGGDSIVAIRVIARANQAGFSLLPNQIFLHQTVAQLAVASEVRVLRVAEQGAVTGPVPLTPIQRELLASGEPFPGHYNQTLLLTLRQGPAGAGPRVWGAAVDRLLAHHDALRSRFALSADGWVQRVEAPAGFAPFTWIDLSRLGAAAETAALKAAAAALQSSLDLERGPVVRFALFDRGEGRERRLLAAFHHLVVDGVSWRVLLEDLEAALAGQELPPKTASFRIWAIELERLAQSGAFADELPHWQSLARQAPPPLPADFAEGDDRIGSAREVVVSLDREETEALLREVPAAFQSQINDALLVALVESCAGWVGERRLLISLEGHGREDVVPDLDLSRTVGWFTSVFPVLLDLRGAPGAAASTLRRLRDQLEAIPRRGAGFGALLHLAGGEASALAASIPRPGLSFNYLGRFDEVLGEAAAFSPAPEAAGPTRHPDRRRSHLLEVDAWVGGGCLRVRFIYSPGRHRRAGVEGLAEGFAARLRDLIAGARSARTGEPVPEDFPLVRLESEELAQLAAGREIEDIYPLSPLQEGLLFHSIAAPGGGVYYRQLRCAVRGMLDSAVFAAACQKVVERHGILRTSFLWQGLASPVQIVHRHARMPFLLEDWRARPSTAQSQDLEALMRADQVRGFALGEAPLMRLTLVRVADDRHQLLWSFHHLVSDGWSFPLLVGEILKVYGALCGGRSVERPMPPPFRDYIAWLQRQDLGDAERFWRGELAGFTTPSPLPLDREVRGGAAPEAGDSAQSFAFLPVESTARLLAWARSEKLTVNTAVQGAWALLLAHYGGEPDVVFGAVSSGRSAPLAGIELMLGVFINTLPVRAGTAFPGPPADWLRGLQQRQAEARLYEYSPLAQVQGWSEVPRGQPLFHTLLAFENFPVDEAVQGKGTSLELAEVDFPEATHYPLTVMMAPGPSLPVRLIYDTRRYEAVTAERLLGHFLGLLGALPGHAGAPESVPLLSAAERHQLLYEWNDTAGPLPGGLLQSLFQEQAARAPHRLAVLGEGGEELSYGELERSSNRLAHRLRAGGCGRGSLVAVYLERSVTMIPALLSILKAGAAYVPLDADYPAARIEWIVASLGIHFLLTGSSRLSALGEMALPSLTHLICLEEPEGAVPQVPAPAVLSTPRDWAGEPESGLALVSDPDDLAYIIFTSGSSGTPKGVAVRHRPVVNLIRWVNSTFDVGESDRVLFMTSLCFDLSVYDIFGILAAGAAVRVATRHQVRDPRSLLRLLVEEPITFWDSAPAALQQLVPFLGEVPAGSGSRRLRLVFLSGDWIPVGLPDAVRGAFPEARVIALGGATEAAIWSNFFPVGRVERDWASIPYGRPIHNARYHVLDGRLEPCPVGAPGDLYIAGDCLAAGYSGDPGLTAAKFMPDPWSVRPGGRLYATGDRARLFANGNLQFLGRRDQQVKLRGFRIELGEIEAVLARHPGVREAVALVRDDEAGNRRLVAYLVAARPPAPPPQELRGFLAQRLPEYMLPSAFVSLDAWPVTANGKLDRRALPAPEVGRARSAVAPRSATEQRLAAVWTEVLRLPAVGVHDNFFELGGDSILSIQIVARAAREGLEITPQQLFTHPSIAELATVAVPVAASASQGAAGPEEGPVPLTPAQHWFFSQDPEDPHHFNQAVLLAVERPLATRRLHRAIAALVRHHAALRLRFHRAPQGWTQEVVAWDGAVPFAVADLSRVPGAAERIGPVAEQVQSSLDLERGPLLRVVLFQLGGGERDRLLVVIHHLAVDGVSWRVLLSDLAGLCEGGEGREPELPPATTSVRRWAELLVERAAGAEMQAELAHWQEAGAAGPALPVDRHGGANDNASAGWLSVELEAAPTRLLLTEVAAAYGAQVPDALLTALVRALGSLTGVPVATIELEGHGREAISPGIDLSRTVGWFTSFFPVRLDLTGARGPGDELRRVKETFRGVPGRGLGYGVLRHLAAVPELAAHPRPEVSFNYLGRLDQALPASALFAPAAEPSGAAESSRQLRRVLLAVNASVLGERLRVSFTYSANRHAATTIQRLASRFQEELCALVEHCAQPEEGGYSPSDFPLAGLGRDTLDRLLGHDRGIEDVYPLAPLQQGLLFHALETLPGQDVYFEQLSCRLAGDLDTAAFARAWEWLSERHAVLRTAFFWQHLPEPVQVVHRRVAPLLVQEDWRRADPSALPRLQVSAQVEDREQGCDLSRAPLARLALRRLGEADWWFLLSFHHVLLDGWSLALLLEDLFALYDRLCRGGDMDLPVPRPYRDYISWVRRQDTGAAEAFWRRTLAGLTAPTQIPTDRPASAQRRGRQDAGEVTARLSVESSGRVAHLARRHQVTPNTLVTGAWGLLLARWSGESDVVFGVVSSGRPASLAGAESMVGLFINTLPARVAVSPETLPVWLRLLQTDQLEMRQYEHTPLATVAGWSEMGPGQSLFESLVVFENFPVGRSAERGEESGLALREVSFHEASNYPVTLLAVPEACLRLTALYDGQRFDPSTVLRLVEQLAVLLEGMADAPETDLFSLPLLTPAARHQLLREWAEEPAGSSGDLGLHQLFARQAERTPEATALVWRDQLVSYAEMSRRARTLAHRLRREGVGPEVAVGILLGRTPGLVVALLAVLEAGGFYVPLDPSLPAERLAYIQRDSGVRVVLSSEGLPWPSAAPETRRLLLSDGGAIEDAEAPVAASPVDAAGEHLAYLIYTSGSTGLPKGVAIEHRSAVVLVRWAQQVFTRGELAAVLASTSISFDLSVFEIFVPLACGGTVVLVDHALAPPPEGVKVRLINTVPSVLAELLGSGMLPSGVTTVNLAGEALQGALAGSILRHPGVERLFNLYGPSEDTTYSTWARVEEGDGGGPPIGRPIDGTRALVLDDAMRPQPIGIPGELYLGGRGLARGYFGRPGLTAAGFVPDPFSAVAGARLYRTGDRVRWRRDGALDYLGRRDHQIKLRGFRIELGEIEAVLAAHPAVDQNAVLALDEGRRLAAFVVPLPGTEEAIPELREYLLARLPAYMVPASFVALTALPRNANGKIDRRELAAGASRNPAIPAHRYAAPETEVEKVLAEIWRQELRLDQVGRYDNFFEQGGHSLLMLRLFGRIKEQFTTSLLMVELFEFPTVSAMASRLAAEQGAPAVAGEELGSGRAEARLQARRRRAR